MTDQIVIIYKDANGADETTFFGTVEEARAECRRMEDCGEVIWAMLGQDQ